MNHLPTTGKCRSSALLGPNVAVLRLKLFRCLGDTELVKGQAAFSYQQKSDGGPKEDAAFSNYRERDADRGTDAEGFGDELRTGFVNADQERDQLKNDGDQTAD